jgi:formylglycine-generating enzyme required for sulfatase activity
LALSKRLIPVIYKPVTEADAPERLRRLQFIRFDMGLGITRPLAQLADALRQDLDWIREHTRMAELAARWEARGRPSSMLLRGDDLVAARAWATKRKQEAPEITQAQNVFLNASIAESRLERRQRAFVQGLVGLLALFIVVGLIGWLNQNYLLERWREFAIVRPYRIANVDPYVLKPEAERALKPGDSFRECANDCPEMIVVPAGEFMMGSPPDEKGRDIDEDDYGHQHKVRIARPFAVSKFDVTFSDWDACILIGGCPREDRADDAGWGRGARPVIYVSWDDAQAYVAWLSNMTGKTYRLLTEAEWEYAARADSTTPYFWGNDIGKGNANCKRCGSSWDNRQTSPVGSFKPNAFGLHDMAGNVWQWVQDCYHLSGYIGAPTDGSVAWTEGADCRNRVMRGGSWSSDPEYLRSAARPRATNTWRLNVIGFRVGRTLTP